MIKKKLDHLIGPCGPCTTRLTGRNKSHLLTHQTQSGAYTGTGLPLTSQLPYPLTLKKQQSSIKNNHRSHKGQVVKSPLES